MPPFVEVLLKTHYREKKIQVLEIGCGNGKAMTELQDWIPSAQIVCMNKQGVVVFAFDITHFHEYH